MDQRIDLCARCVYHVTQRCVLQDDLFYESLTVWETLKYAAALRLPHHMTKQAKRRRVDLVIAALGLEACRNTIIGVALTLVLKHPKPSTLNPPILHHDFWGNVPLMLAQNVCPLPRCE